MSIYILSKVWWLPMPPARKLVLLALADHSDKSGASCFPSVDRIVGMTGLSRRSVQQQLRALEGDNIIAKERDSIGGRGLTNSYRIVLQNSEANSRFPDEKTANGIRETAKEVRGKKAKTANVATENGELRSPEPLLSVSKSESNPSNPEKQIGLDGRILNSLSTYYFQKTRKPLSTSNIEKERLLEYLEKYNEEVVLYTWRLFLERSAGLDGLSHPVAKFLQEFDVLHEIYRFEHRPRNYAEKMREEERSASLRSAPHTLKIDSPQNAATPCRSQ